MSARDPRDLLERSVLYAGGAITVRGLEETILEGRARQDRHLVALRGLREKNGETQAALESELEKLRVLSDHLARSGAGANEDGALAAVVQVWRRLPFVRGRISPPHSIEELLRAQYEQSALRLKEAAELCDRLLLAKADLAEEIKRLNEKIVEAARNEALAEEYVGELQLWMKSEEARAAELPRGSPEVREARAKLDEAVRKLGEHSFLLRLYGTAEERLERLKESTRALAQTIAQLHSDLALYVTAAGEKLDLIGGQIQAIGAAADASLVILELRASLEALTESVNRATRFVAATQAFFRENVERMVGELELYDRETEAALAANIAENQLENELRALPSGAEAIEEERASAEIRAREARPARPKTSAGDAEE